MRKRHDQQGQQLFGQDLALRFAWWFFECKKQPQVPMAVKNAPHLSAARRLTFSMIPTLTAVRYSQYVP
jgi:hypothetical protein